MRIEPTFLRSKVARRVFAMFVLCALGPLCTLAAFSYLQVRERLADQADDYLRKECRLAGQSLVDYIEYLEADLRTLSIYLNAEEQKTQCLLEEELVAPIRARFSSLVVLQEGVQGSTPLLGEPLRPDPRPFTESEHAHLADGSTLVAVDRVGGQARIFVARALDAHHTLLGEVRQQPFWSSVETDTEFFVLDEQSHCLFSTRPDPAQVGALTSVRGDRSTSGRFDWKGEGGTHRAAFKNLFMVPAWHMDWTLACSRAQEAILSPVRSFGRNFGLVSTLALWIVLLLSMGQIRRSMVPIEELRDATRAIADNDLARRVHIVSDDEFEELGDSFNEMADSIRTRTQELEAANRAKAEFLANMSHELRTPMTAVLGFAEICMDPEMEEEDRHEHLEIVCRNGKHLLRVINDILDLSKIEADRLVLEYLECSPGEMVADAVSLLEATAQEKGIDLVVDIRPEVPEVVSTDPTRLHQILMNLLGNAIKFTQEGSVRLAVSLLPSKGEDLLEFEVTDTGIGMTEEQVEQIFAPFVQADTTMTRKFGGTGLGLSISRSLARLLGGDLQCRSVPGGGSTFTLTVAARHPRFAAPEPPSALPAARAAVESEAAEGPGEA